MEYEGLIQRRICGLECGCRTNDLKTTFASLRLLNVKFKRIDKPKAEVTSPIRHDQVLYYFRAPNIEPLQAIKAVEFSLRETSKNWTLPALVFYMANSTKFGFFLTEGQAHGPEPRIPRFCIDLTSVMRTP